MTEQAPADQDESDERPLDEVDQERRRELLEKLAEANLESRRARWLT